MSLQIDAMQILDNMVRCRINLDNRDVRMFISKDDYEALIEDGFFIRDGKSADSSGCINTTNVYQKKTK